MEITGGTGAPGPAGPAGPATKGQDANYLVWIDPSNSNKATAYNTHTGVNDYTGTTTDVVLSSILTALGSGGGVVKLSPDTHTWAATITPTAPIRLVGSGVATVISVSGNITPFVLNGTDQAIERMTIQGNGSTAHALTSAAATRMHVDWVRITGFAGSPVVCTGTHDNSSIEHIQFGGNTATTDMDLSAATGIDVDRLYIDQDPTDYAIRLGTKCTLRRSGGKSMGTTADSFALIQGDDSAVESCVADWSDTNHNAAIWTAYNAQRPRIVNNRILGNGTAGGIAIGGYGGSPATASGAVVEGNILYDVMNDGILVFAATAGPKLHAIVGNIINTCLNVTPGNQSTAPWGIEIFADGCVVQGNTVNGSQGGGIHIGQQSYLTVNGNVVTGNYGHGLYCDCQYSTISGNTSRLNGQGYTTSAGLLIGAGFNVVRGNVCTDNGTGDGTGGTYTGFGIIMRSNFAGTPNTGNIVEGNLCTDTRSGGSRIQRFGIYIYNSAATTDGNIYRANTVSNNVQGAILENGGSGGTGGSSDRFDVNTGYNPKGHAPVTPGASPWTYTAGNTRETLYLYGGTVSSVVWPAAGGDTIAAASPASVQLEPHDQVTVTYSVAPSATTVRH